MMAAFRSDVREELIAFWAQKGVALCAEAQADGVPCTDLGRECETCAMAVRALRDSLPFRADAEPRTDLPECGP
jgi:hypothetical protein